MVSTLQFDARLDPDRPQLGIEGLLSDRQAADQDGHDPLDPPDEHHQRRLDRGDLEHPLVEQRVGGGQLCGGGRDQRLEDRKRGQQALRDDRLIGAVGRVLELVGGVDLGVELDRLMRWSGEAEHLEPVSRLTADRPRLERPGDRVRVVLEHDHVEQVARVRVDLDQPAAQHLGRSREAGGGHPYPLRAAGPGAGRAAAAAWCTAAATSRAIPSTAEPCPSRPSRRVPARRPAGPFAGSPAQLAQFAGDRRAERVALPAGQLEAVQDDLLDLQAGPHAVTASMAGSRRR